MPKHLKLLEHLSLAELEQRYRHAKDPVERSQWQILWLLAKGTPSEQVALATGYSLNWIRRIAQRYNTTGCGGRTGSAPSQPWRSTSLICSPARGVTRSAASCCGERGMWTGPQVAAWIAAKVGHPVHPQRGWEWLHRLGFHPKMARSWQPRTSSDPQHGCNTLSPPPADS